MTTEGLAETERAAVRARVFTHLSGVVMAPTVSALWERGALELLTSTPAPVLFADVVRQTHANAGYLRVALRLLASCGWLVEQPLDNSARMCALTPEGHAALRLAHPLYRQVTASFLPKALGLEDFLVRPSDESFIASVGDLVALARNGWGIEPSPNPTTAQLHDRIRGHLEGMLVAPAMVALARGGILARLAEGPLDLRSMSAGEASVGCLFDLLSTTGYVERAGHIVQLTGCGRYAAQIASVYGSRCCTCRCLPSCRHCSSATRASRASIRRPRNDGQPCHERLGRRRSAPHVFQKLDEIIVDIFNRPLSEQPRGLCDMGCGDGTLLAHLYSVVKERTARGRSSTSTP